MTILLCWSVNTRPQSGKQPIEGNIKIFEKWEKHTSEQLLKKALEYMTSEEHLDSLLVTLNIVANRYYANPKDKQRQKEGVMAFSGLGLSYIIFFNEYPKAYHNLLIAKKLATDGGFTTFLPEIEMNIINIKQSLMALLEEEDYSSDFIEQYKKVFRQAIEIEDYQNITIAIMNMAIVACENGNEDFVADEIATFEKQVFPPQQQTPQYQYARIFVSGIKAFAKKDYCTALEEFDKLMDMKVVDKTIDLAHQFNYHVMRALVFKTLGEKDMIIKELDAMEKLGLESSMSLLALNAFKYKYEYYKTTVPQKDSCAKYHLLFLESKDSMMNHRRLNSLRETELMFQLNVANEQMRTQTYEQRLQRHITVGTGIITLLLTVLLVILYRNYRNVSLKNRLLYQRNIELLQANNEKNNLQQKYKSSSLTNTDKESMQQDIISVMENSDEIFQQDFSLTRLATILEADHHHVSQVINEQLNQNFASLLNHYRIIEACRRMNTPEIYGNLTIEGIANGVGFKSRPYFVKVFKEITGLTPSAYQKLAKEQNMSKTT